MRLDIEIKKVGKNLFVASCRDLPGCHVQASDEQQARKRISEAVKLMIISFKQHFERVPLEG